MKICLELSSLKKTRWYEFAIRFVFGGAITVATGLIAKRFGPEVAGLFLAFPAILPASATLISKHEREKKHAVGMHGTRRGRAVASVDAAGAAMGTLGLIVFGAYVWRMLPEMRGAIVLPVATLLWLGISVWVWTIRKTVRKEV